MLGVDDRLITPATIKWVKVGLVAGLATIPTTILLYYVLGMAVDAAWQGSNMLRQWFWILCGLVLLKAVLAWLFRTGQFRASSEAKLNVRDQIYRQVVRLGPGLLGKRRTGEIANTATEAFEKSSKASTAKLVNLAGRQRALSQRLAKNYFLLATGGDFKGARAQLASDADEFHKAMATLASAPLSTPAIRDELALGDGQWLFFSAALQRKADARGLADVATTSERLLEVTDRLTNLYDAALKQVLG